MRCSSLSIKALFVPDCSMRYRDTDGVMDCRCKSTTCGLTEQSSHTFDIVLFVG